jgi:hypothetical protein
MSDRKPLDDVGNYSDQTIEKEIQCRLAIEKKAFIDQEVKRHLDAEKTLYTEIKSYQNDAGCSFKAESDVKNYEVTSPVKKKKMINDNEIEHNNPTPLTPCMVDGMSYTSTNISKTVGSSTSALSGDKRVSRANAIPTSKSCHNAMMIIFLKLAH